MDRLGFSKAPENTMTKFVRASLSWTGAAVLGVGLAAAIAGCTAQQSSVARVMEALGVDHLALSEETRQELARFDGGGERLVLENRLLGQDQPGEVPDLLPRTD